MSYQFQLKIHKYCIQTTIKRRYEQLIAQYFSADSNHAEIEKQIEILKNALEQFDFHQLRTTYPKLAGGQNSQICLSLDSQGRILLCFNGEEIISDQIQNSDSPRGDAASFHTD